METRVTYTLLASDTLPIRNTISVTAHRVYAQSIHTAPSLLTGHVKGRLHNPITMNVTACCTV